MARAADALVAEIARRAGRATAEDIDDALAFLAEQRRTTRTLSLAQVLIKRKKIYAEEFLDLNRRLEAPLLVCAACGRAQAAKDVDDASSPDEAGASPCLTCGVGLDVGALVKALPPEATALTPRTAREPGPITRLSGPVPTVPLEAAAPAGDHRGSESLTEVSRPAFDPASFDPEDQTLGYESDARLPPPVESEEYPGALAEALDAEERASDEERKGAEESRSDEESRSAEERASGEERTLGPADDARAPAPAKGFDAETETLGYEEGAPVRAREGAGDSAASEEATEHLDDAAFRSPEDGPSSFPDEIALPSPADAIPDSGEIDRAIERGVSLGASQRLAREAAERVAREAAERASPREGAPRSGSGRPGAGAGVGLASGGARTGSSGGGRKGAGGVDPSAPTPGDPIGRAILAGGDGAAGRRFAGFEIISTLGVGGMGVVYKARQLTLDRIVALKVLREGEGARGEQVERFQREARAAAKLAHPNIVAIHEVGISEGIHFFTMDLVEGETLHDKLLRGDRPPPMKAAAILAVVARAVHYAHERSIIHRDLKPGNVLITQEGVPKITDFGLAKSLDAVDMLTQSGAAIGTPLYMSPEQVKGDLKRIDARSDVFSLGTLLYQLLTGTLPFNADWHVELYNKILTADPEPPRKRDPKIPRDLETICLRALEKRPADRYQSALALAQDLENAAKGEAILARPPSSTEKLARIGKRYRAALIAAAAVLLLASAGVGTTLTLLERQRAEGEAAARDRARMEARALAGEAGAAAREGRWKDALERTALLRARFPESEESQETRLLEAEADLRLGRPQEALRALARAYRRAGDDAERGRALVGIGAAYAAADDHERALAALAKARERAPGTRAAAQADLLAGRLLAELDDPEAARARLQAALAAGGGTSAEGATSTAGGAAPAGLGKDERMEARKTLAWLDALANVLPLPGAAAGAVGDITGDGRPELLLVHGGELAATELGPEGAVVVARGAAVGPRDAVLDLAAADVDGDGRAEAILVARTAGEGTVLVVLGRGKAGGPFTPLFRGRLEGRVARGGLSAGDIDGDGRADIVIATAPSAAKGGGLRVFRSAPDGGFQPIPLADDPAARGTATLSVLVADLEKDGRAEVVVGTGGGSGDDVRIYRWNAGAGGLDVDWRQKTGPVTALAADDVDGDGARDLLLGRATAPLSAARRDERFLADGLYLLRAGEGGKGWAVEWRDAEDAGGGGGGGRSSRGGGSGTGAGWGTGHDAIGPLCALPGLEEARIRGLASGDLSASGAASVITLAEPAARPAGPAAADDRERPSRAVLVHSGFGRGGAVERRRLVFRDAAIEWARAADLDADGDAELIVGGPAGVRIYGVRGKR